MTRRMADSVTPRNCPPGFDLYLGYVDGHWPSYNGLVALYPNAVHVPCTVFGSSNVGVVLDVELGDATPEQAPPWVLRRRAAGVDPTVYCSASAWATVRAAFRRAGVAEPHWLIASYSNPPDPTIPVGAHPSIAYDAFSRAAGCAWRLRSRDWQSIRYRFAVADADSAAVPPAAGLSSTDLAAIAGVLRAAYAADPSEKDVDPILPSEHTVLATLMSGDTESAFGSLLEKMIRSTSPESYT